MKQHLTLLGITILLGIAVISLIPNEPILQNGRKIKQAKDTIVEDTIKPLQEIKIRRQGNIATDFNNVGCIRNGNPRIDALAIGYCNTINGKFLVFDLPQKGFMALQIWIRENNNLSLQQAIRIYAPSVENNTKGYIANLCKSLGCDYSTQLKDINEMQLISKIAEIEGWKE